jgi:hypothetical protein
LAFSGFVHRIRYRLDESGFLSHLTLIGKAWHFHNWTKALVGKDWHEYAVAVRERAGA